ncbi:hypothetical protein ACJIZ3_002267 [Penstemon smallii]|uniref:COX assembly mitochondrial protein n=1 Tax=Penstemon smallii TaxID=265156 RepID=A0ABD3U5Z2_9LAMI
MGFVEEARENHVKKKVEEEDGDLLEPLPYAPLTIINGSGLLLKMKQKALKECDRYTSRYAECAVGRTISVVWKCRKQAKELNECLHQFTNDSILEQMKKEYMLQEEAKGSLRL